MGIDIRHAGSTLTTVRATTPRFHEAADMGRVGSGTMAIDNSAGTLEIIGHKPWRATEDACAVENIGRGFMGVRRYKRNTARTGPERFIEADLLDLNAKLAFKVIRGREWRKRPKNETIGERLTDLLASGFLALQDNGFVQYPDITLDGGDLRGQRPGDVLMDMATRAGFNFFAYYDEAEDDASLWFQDSNTSTDWSSDLRISNVIGDVDGTTTFYASLDTEMTRSPEQTVSGVWMPYKKGNVYRTRAATEENYEPRDGTAPNANVKRRARARNIADRFLRHHKNEEDRITTTIQVPATKVNLVRAGQRIECKFSHFATEGYGSFTWFRVMERTVVPLVAPADELYNITMVLSPQEEASSGCASIVQAKDAALESSVTLTLDSSPTIGNLLVTVLEGAGSSLPEMFDGSWTLLGNAVAYPKYFTQSPGENSDAVHTAIYAKVAPDTDPVISRQSTSAEIRWRCWELSGASIDNTTVLEFNNIDPGWTNVNVLANLGTFSDASGVAVMGIGAPRETDQAPRGTALTFASGWTERWDNGIDGNEFSEWCGIADAEPTGDDLPVTVDIQVTIDDQWIGRWGAVAVLFGCE